MLASSKLLISYSNLKSCRCRRRHETFFFTRSSRTKKFFYLVLPWWLLFAWRNFLVENCQLCKQRIAPPGVKIFYFLILQYETKIPSHFYKLWFEIYASMLLMYLVFYTLLDSMTLIYLNLSFELQVPQDVSCVSWFFMYFSELGAVHKWHHRLRGKGDLPKGDINT